jgi:DNA-binding transcriptional LysR family regulator
VGEVRIGALSSIAAGLVAAVIDRLSRKYPRVSYRVVSDGPPTLFRHLRERDLDMAIWRVLEPIRDKTIDAEMLFEDRMVVVAAVNHPWARRRRIELEELAKEIWTLPEPEHPIGAAMVEAFRVNGLEAPRATVATSAGNLRDTLLATGRFLTLLPESLLHFTAKLSSFKVLPVELPTTRGPTCIMTLKNRELSPVAKLFIECAREVAKPLAKRR